MAQPKKRDVRIVALRRFATAITVLTIFGHSLLGFEQPVLFVFASLATAYGLELLLEVVDARARKRAVAFRGGWVKLIDFLLPAHITGLAVAMLLYPNERVTALMFATALGMASKWIFRVSINGKSRHFLNPSNTGIAITLILFPWVGIAPPYHFTENVAGAWDGAIPAIVIVTGSLLNGLLTGRLPLILSWLGFFVLQAIVRAFVDGTPIVPALLPMTGMAFLLYTFYMAPDPGTTPMRRRDQIIFGASVAIAYGVLMKLHIVFGLFFALVIVCTARGLWHATRNLLGGGIASPATVPAAVPAAMPAAKGAAS